jgi:hypothetical protein
MSAESQHAPTIARAEQVLIDALGRSIRLGDTEVLSDADRRNTLLRCRNLSSEMPETFIIKQVVAESWKPDDNESWDTQRFFKDWAGAQFLSELEVDPPCSPRCFGGDRELGMFVTEDLGNPRTLVEPLLNETAEAAEQALLAYSASLGRLHSATAGRSQQYADLHARLSGRARPSKKSSAFDIDNLVSRLALIDIDADAALLQELEVVRAALDDTGPFHSFIHGDPCPDNIFMIDGNVLLIDFEFARFGHALIDGVYGRMMFPTCWCCNRLPRPVIKRMEDAYRTELARTVPQAADDALFNAALVHACAYWVEGSLSWHLEASLAEDREWGISTVRSRILARLDAFAATSEEYRLLPSLRDCAIRVRDELKRRWPETEPLPLYPAFRA